MNKKIKAVFFDIDGTMYNHAIHDAPESTKVALCMLHENGVKVGIATSRCRYEMKNTSSFFQSFSFDGCIYDGGALVMDKEKVLSSQIMNVQDVERVLSYAEQHNLSARYSTFDDDYFAFVPKNEDREIFFELYLNAPILKKYQNDEVLNMLVYTRTQKVKDEIMNLLPHISMINHGRVLEINSGQVDKSIGVETIVNSWGLQMDEVMCFGDGANDVNFLKAAGVGVAMGNGCDEVKGIADYVTKRIEEDGIFHALRMYKLI